MPFFRLIESYHGPLLCLAVGKVQQSVGLIFSEIENPRFHDRPTFANRPPGGPLAFAVDRSLDLHPVVGRRVLERTCNDALLTDRQLHVQRRIFHRAILLRERKDAQWHPLDRVRIDVRNGGRNCLGLLRVLVGRGDDLTFVVDVVSFVIQTFPMALPATMSNTWRSP